MDLIHARKGRGTRFPNTTRYAASDWFHAFSIRMGQVLAPQEGVLLIVGDSASEPGVEGFA